MSVKERDDILQEPLCLGKNFPQSCQFARDSTGDSRWRFSCRASEPNDTMRFLPSFALVDCTKRKYCFLSAHQITAKFRLWHFANFAPAIGAWRAALLSLHYEAFQSNRPRALQRALSPHHAIRCLLLPLSHLVFPCVSWQPEPWPHYQREQLLTLSVAVGWCQQRRCSSPYKCSLCPATIPFPALQHTRAHTLACFYQS